MRNLPSPLEEDDYVPTSPAELFRSVGLELTSSVAWGEEPQTRASGVYCASIHADPDKVGGLSKAPVSTTRIREWCDRVGGVRLCGSVVEPVQLAAHIAQWWINDEPVVYIGKATSLRSRIGGYYKTLLGDIRPHRGGYWLKTLSSFDSFTVHFAEAQRATPECYERRMLGAFVRGVSDDARSLHPEPQLTLPFANLEYHDGSRRHRRVHGLENVDLR